MSAISKTDVVVGIDGSVTSTAAAVWAAGEADRRRSRLVLLYSYVLYAYGSKDAALPGSVPYEEAEIAADQLLSEATDAVRAVYPKIQIEVLQQHEAAATALLEVTGEAALTVIASQAKHQAVETLIGSVATYTAEQSQGPVVVLRGHAAAAPATGPVVVGVDGSSESEPAIDFAFEAAQLGITANTIAPGLIDTRMLHSSFAGQDELAASADSLPLGRIGTAEEVAAAIGFLASPAASYITGSVVDVNGGLRMQ